MTSLWQAFEQSPCLMEVGKTWRQRLGTEFESFARFFAVTDVLASCYPGDNPYKPWRVVVDPDWVIAVDDETEEQHSLSRCDVVCYRINMRSIASELAETLDLRPQFEPLGQTQHTSRIGTLPASLDGRPVYFTFHTARSALLTTIHEIARHAGRPYFLLHLNGCHFDSQVETMLERIGGAKARIADLISVTANARFQKTLNAKETIAKTIGVDFASSFPRYQFVLDQDTRTVAFDSRPFLIAESAGLWYIARLLAVPGARFRATELQSQRAGVHEKAASGSKGEIIDTEAKRSYQRRLAELAEDIEEAEKFHDFGRLEALQNEREQLMETLRSVTGLGGQIRVEFDADRARNTVSKAIRRAIKAIHTKCPPMALHLEASLTLGLELQYSPPDPIDWVL